MDLATKMFDSAVDTTARSNPEILKKFIKACKRDLEFFLGRTRRKDEYVLDDARRILRAAALCHDIGHFPLSHTLERAFEKEFWSAPIPLHIPSRAPHEMLSIEVVRHIIASSDPALEEWLGRAVILVMLAAGHGWEDLQKLAGGLADHIFISRNLKQLKARGVDMYFHPGTHDFVAFDAAWCGEKFPQIPIYLRANSGHGKKGHPAGEKDEQNKSAFLMHHFFGGEPMLDPPSVRHEVKGGVLSVSVRFKPGSGESSGRIWWMYDRGPDGSAAYIREMIPDDQWKDMKRDAAGKTWTAEIKLKTGASHIDFFSNHGKTVQCVGRKYRTYISSPYTRVAIKG